MKLERFNMIERLFEFSDCRVCNNTRKISIKQIRKDENLLDRINTKECPKCSKILDIRNIAFESGMNRDEMEYDFRSYKKIPCPDGNITEKLEALEILEGYCKNFKNALEGKINIYLYSNYMMLIHIVGCAILNNLMSLGHSVRIYDGQKMLDSVVDSFKNNRKLYRWEVQENEKINFSISNMALGCCLRLFNVNAII